MLPVEQPFKTYTDRDGKPLNAGFVYFGQPNLDPISNPVTVYWDAAGTIPANQPLRTMGGYIVRNGTPANVFFDGEYSELVNDSRGSRVFYAGNSNEFSVLTFVNKLKSSIGASLIGFIQTAYGAFSTTISEWLSRHVDVWDFMSPAMRADALSGTPTLDHSSAWNLAINALNGAGRVIVSRKGGAVYLLKDTVHLGSSNTVDSRIVIDIEPGTLVLATLPSINHVLFSIKNYPGHFNQQGINNLHAVSTNGNGVCMKFNGQCYGSFENNYMEGFNVGRWFSNEGTAVYNEFIRFANTEIHLCNTGTLMSKDGDVGGTDTSMHGICDRSCTVNVGSGQVGLQVIDICWYNADFDLKFFSQASSQAIIKMTTNAPDYNKGVFGSGSITCEGPAKITGVGRFYFSTGFLNYDVSFTDTLDAPNAWEQGFMCSNYIRSRNFGSSGLTVAELFPKSLELGSAGPFGSFALLRGTGIESLVAVAYDATANTANNGFFTGYTGYQKNYDVGGVLGCFLSSDGTEISSRAATTTQCSIKHNNQYILRFDGTVKSNNLEGFFLGSGGAAIYSGTDSPEGIVTASVGSTYRRRDGGAGTTFYVKESGSGNTGWVAK